MSVQRATNLKLSDLITASRMVPAWDAEPGGAAPGSGAPGPDGAVPMSGDAAPEPGDAAANPEIISNPFGSVEQTRRPASPWNLQELAGRVVELSAGSTSVALSASIALVHEAQLRREPAAWVSIAGSTFFPPDVANSGIDLENLPVIRVDDARCAARAADLLLRSGGFSVVVIDGIGSPYAQSRSEATSQAKSKSSSRQATRGIAGAQSRPHSLYADRQANDAVLDESFRGRDLPDALPTRRVHTRGSGRRSSHIDSSHREVSATIPTAAQTRLAGLAKRHRAVLVCLTNKSDQEPSLGSLISLRGTGKVRKTSFDRFTLEIEVLKDKRRGPEWKHSEELRGPAGLH